MDEYVSEKFYMQESDKSHLSKVVLNTSNACNLKCKYCYVPNGNYGRVNQLMSYDTLLEIGKQLKDEGIRNIKIVSFFGGEPLLNKDLIVKGLEYFEKNFCVEIFEIVTNGIFLDEEILSIFEKYPVNLNISIDGPKDITDELRGNFTYDSAISAIELAKKYKLRKLIGSATFTKRHLEMGYSRESIELFFRDLGVQATISNVLSSDNAYFLSASMSKFEFREDVKKSLRKIMNKNFQGTINSYLETLLQSVFFKFRSIFYCDDLIPSVSRAYDYNGDLYNCFHFWGKEDFRVENEAKVATQIENVNNKNSHKICEECWANGMCHFCTAAIINGLFSFPYEEDFCVDKEAFQICMEEFLEYVHEGYGDQICDNYDEFFCIYGGV